MSNDYGNRLARRPLIRVRPAADGRWRAEGEDTIRDGHGDSPEAALGKWFLENAERLGFDVRVS